MEIKRFIVGSLATNCYFLISQNELAIVDPGGNADIILEEVKKIGEKLKYIINTHHHLDHTLANMEIKNETGAKILIHEAEKEFIDFKADLFFEDKIKIGESVLKVLHTPGHTKGSICLLGDDFILTGDTLFKDGHGRTDLPGGSQKAMEESLKRLSKLLKPGMTVYPGHGETFEIKSR